MSAHRYKTYTYYFPEGCPRPDECDHEGFKRSCLCQSSKSQEDARNKLYAHLLRTRGHNPKWKAHCNELWKIANAAPILRYLNTSEIGDRQIEREVYSPLVGDQSHMWPLKCLVIAHIPHAGYSCIAVNRNIYRPVISGHPHIDIRSAQLTFASRPLSLLGLFAKKTISHSARAFASMHT